MAIRLFYNNSDFDKATLTASSQAQYLPATNVQNSFRTRVWQTLNTNLYETLTIDMGKPVSVDACVVFYTNLEELTSPLDGPITLSGNSINSFVTSPAAPFTATLQQGTITDSTSPQQYYSTDFGVSPGSPTYRYWQIKFKKQRAGETITIGRIFLGQTYDLAALPMYNGVQINLVDNSNKSKGVGLNTYVEVLPQYKEVVLALQPMANADIANLDTILYQIGQSKSIFLQIDQADPYTEILYVKVGTTHTKKTSIVSPTNVYWGVQLSFEEQL